MVKGLAHTQVVSGIACLCDIDVTCSDRKLRDVHIVSLVCLLSKDSADYLTSSIISSAFSASVHSLARSDYPVTAKSLCKTRRIYNS